MRTRNVWTDAACVFLLLSFVEASARAQPRSEAQSVPGGSHTALCVRSGSTAPAGTLYESSSGVQRMMLARPTPSARRNLPHRCPRGYYAVPAFCVDLHLPTPGTGTPLGPASTSYFERSQTVLAAARDFVTLHQAAIQKAWRAHDIEALVSLNGWLWHAQLEDFHGSHTQTPVKHNGVTYGRYALGPGASHGASPQLALSAAGERASFPTGAADLQALGRLATSAPDVLVAEDPATLAVVNQIARPGARFITERARELAARANIDWLRATHVDPDRIQLLVHRSAEHLAAEAGGLLGLRPVVADDASALPPSDAVVFVYATGQADLAAILGHSALAGRVVLVFACNDEDGRVPVTVASSIVANGHLRALVMSHGALGGTSSTTVVARELRDAIGAPERPTWYNFLRQLAPGLDLSLLVEALPRESHLGLVRS